MRPPLAITFGFIGCSTFWSSSSPTLLWSIGILSFNLLIALVKLAIEVFKFASSSFALAWRSAASVAFTSASLIEESVLGFLNLLTAALVSIPLSLPCASNRLASWSRIFWLILLFVNPSDTRSFCWSSEDIFGLALFARSITSACLFFKSNSILDLFSWKFCRSKPLSWASAPCPALLALYILPLLLNSSANAFWAAEEFLALLETPFILFCNLAKDSWSFLASSGVDDNSFLVWSIDCCCKFLIFCISANAADAASALFAKFSRAFWFLSNSRFVADRSIAWSTIALLSVFAVDISVALAFASGPNAPAVRFAFLVNLSNSACWPVRFLFICSASVLITVGSVTPPVNLAVDSCCLIATSVYPSLDPVFISLICLVVDDIISIAFCW